MDNVLPQLGPAPDHALLNITRRCNQACVFCFEGRDRNWKEMTLEHVAQLLDRTRAAGFEHAVLMGGEALLRRDIGEVVRHALAAGIELTAFTNGRPLARPGLIEEVAEAGLRKFLVSCHYADAESYARGTGVKAGGFEEWRRGLEKIGAYARAHPDDGFYVDCETLIFRFNVGGLRTITDQVSQALGRTCTSHAFKLPLALDGRQMRTHEWLFDPLLERREELLELLRSRTPDDPPLSFHEVPLCYFPGWEHLSQYARNLVGGVRISCNFEDKERLQGVHSQQLRHLKHAYRWVCRECRLQAMCPASTTSWSAPAMSPRRELKPVPCRDRDLEDVLADMEVAPAERDAIARSLRRQLGEPELPELPALQALERLSGGELVVEAVYAGAEPLLDADLRFGDRRAHLRIAVPSGAGPAGFLIGGLSVELEGWRDLPRESVAALLERLQVLAQIDRAQLRSLDCLLPTEAFERTHSCRRLTDMLGTALWPGFGSFAGWSTEEATFHDAKTLLLALRHPSGQRAEAAIVVCHKPELDLPDLDLTLVARAGENAAFLGAFEQRAGDDLLAVHQRLESLADALCDTFTRAGVVANRGGAEEATLPAGTLVVVFRDRAGEHPDCVFHIAALQPDEKVLEAWRGIGLRHQIYAPGPLLESLCRLMRAAIRKLPEPPDERNCEQNAELLRQTLGKVRLPARLSCSVTAVRPPPDAAPGRAT